MVGLSSVASRAELTHFVMAGLDPAIQLSATHAGS
jgi:hypothetical protein